MADILLAHSYFLKYDPKQLQKMRPYAPLATLYAASALRARGYSVALFDAMLADGEDEFARALDQHQPRVLAAGPDVSDHPELYFPHGVQLALVGEADHTLIEVIDALALAPGMGDG